MTESDDSRMMQGSPGESDSETGKKSRTSTGKRKFHQKSRNGCSTCKKRRVKCDENRPTCKKCQNLNLVCGYTLDNGRDSSGMLHPGSKMQENGHGEKRRKFSSSQSPQNSTGHISNRGSFSSDISGSLDGSSVNRDVKGEDVKTETEQSGNGTGSLLNAGNLNNLNLSHLVNNLSGLGDFRGLGNLATLTNLATLAQLPIDLSNLGALLDTQVHQSMTNQEINNQMEGSNASKRNEATPEDEEGAEKPFTNGDEKGKEIQQDDTSDLNDNASPKGGYGPKISPNVNTSKPNYSNNPLNNPLASMNSSNLNMLDLRLIYHYTTVVAATITDAGISDTDIWKTDIPMLAFEHPYLMHSLLAFSATHLSRTEKGLDQCVTCHRGDALRLLREAVLDINADNTDALVASALILIMDSLANASFPSSTSPKSLPASAWIFHVKGAATILTAVWPLTEASRFYKFISVDLGDLGDIINQKVNLRKESGEKSYYTDLQCHDTELTDLYPVEIDSPYLITLAYLSKLHKERYKSDFILRIFSFPALLDKAFLSLLMTGDINSMRIMRSYYKLLRSFTTEMKDKVWFLEGVSSVLPADVEEYAGGAGGMHMMLDFLGGGPSIVVSELDEELTKFDPSGTLANRLIDTDNLPSDITRNLDVMQGDNGFMNIK